MYLTKINAITSSDTVLYPGEYAQYVGMIPGSFDGVSDGNKYVIHTMLDMLFPKDLKQELKHLGGDRAGVIFASGASEWAGASLLTPSIDPDYRYHAPFLELINIVAGKFANSIGFTGYISSDATSCISSYKAIQEAKWLIDSDQLDTVLVVGIDDQINASTIRVFGMTHASLSQVQEDIDNILPSAFDSTNQGFRISQGCGFALFERNSSTAVAEINSISIGAEAYSNPLGMNPSGKGYYNVINKCLRNNKNPTFIKTHGTGTLTNNKAESTALIDCFGDNFIATSYKAEFGHTLGASGIVELFIALEDAKSNKIRGIKNRTAHDDNFLSCDIEKEIESILLLGAGMGNVFAAILVDNIRKKDGHSD